MRARTQEEEAVIPRRDGARLACGVSGRGVGWQWPAAGSASGSLAAAVLEEWCVHRSPPGGDQGLWTPGLGVQPSSLYFFGRTTRHMDLSFPTRDRTRAFQVAQW